MESIQFRGNIDFMQSLTAQLAADLQTAGLNEDFQLSAADAESGPEPTRGDPVTWAMVVMTAVGTGGAFSVLLGKDGFLSALARVLEKHVESRKVEVLIETKQGEKIKVSGPIGEIKSVLKQIKGLKQ